MDIVSFHFLLCTTDSFYATSCISSCTTTFSSLVSELPSCIAIDNNSDVFSHYDLQSEDYRYNHEYKFQVEDKDGQMKIDRDENMFKFDELEDSDTLQMFEPSTHDHSFFECYYLNLTPESFEGSEESELITFSVNTAYKTVDKKVKPIPALFPQEARVHRHFSNNPLDSLPLLSKTYPPFIPTNKLTQEWLDNLDLNPTNFLWPQELNLFLHILQINKSCLAFTEADRGNL